MGETAIGVSGTHPAAPTACDRLNHHRVADFFRDLDRLLFGVHSPIAAPCNPHARFPRLFARRVLISHASDGPGPWPNKLHVAACPPFPQTRILYPTSLPRL